MPKHFHSEHYLAKPFEIFPQGNIHPEIEHRPHALSGAEAMGRSDATDIKSDTEKAKEHHTHYMLPAVFIVEKVNNVTLRYLGPGVYYITGGEASYVLEHPHTRPGQTSEHANEPTEVKAGAVIHVEKGDVLRWCIPVEVRGFATFYVPVSVESFDDFIVSPGDAF